MMVPFSNLQLESMKSEDLTKELVSFEVLVRLTVVVAEECKTHFDRIAVGTVVVVDEEMMLKKVDYDDTKCWCCCC